MEARQGTETMWSKNSAAESIGWIPRLHPRINLGSVFFWIAQGIFNSMGADMKWNPSDIGGYGNLCDVLHVAIEGSYSYLYLMPRWACECELERPGPLQPFFPSSLLYITSGSLPVMNINSSIGMVPSTQHGDLEEVIGAPFLGFMVGSV
jgi:hypothetical protein